MNRLVYPLLALLAGAVSLDLLPANAMATAFAESLRSDGTEEGESKGAPRLVVFVSVSELRTDLLELTLGESGGAGLLTEGRYYPAVFHPLLSADEAASQAILHSGALALENGIPARRPLRRLKSGIPDRSRSVLSDESASGLGTRDGFSPRGLLSAVLGDRIKEATGGRGLVYSVAVRPEEAIIAGGSEADGVFWIDETRGDWASSGYYPAKLPWYITKLPSPRVKLLKGTAWKPHFQDFEDKYGRWSLSGASTPFDHSLKRAEAYLNTPLSQEEVTEAALALLESAGLGTDGATDYLALTYSLDVPDDLAPGDLSPEVMDGYYRLEEELKRLRKRLPKETILILAGNGMERHKAPEERENRVFYLDKCKALTNLYLDTKYGVKGLVKELTEEGQLYLDESLIKSRRISEEGIREEVAAFLGEFAGVAYAFPESELRRVALSGDGSRKLLTAANSVLPKERGDVVFGLHESFSYGQSDRPGGHTRSPQYGGIISPLIIIGGAVEPEKVTAPTDLRRVPEIVARVLRIRPPTASM